MRTVFRDTLSVFITRLILLIVAFIGSIIVARVLGPHGKGQLYFLLTISTLIVTFMKLGVGQASTYFLGNKTFDFNETVTGGVTFSLIMGALGILIGVIFFILTKATLFDIELNLFLIELATIPMLILYGYCSYVFLGIKEIHLRNRFILISPFIYTFLLCFLLFNGMLTLKAVVYLHLLTSIIPVIWVLYHFVNHNHFRWKLNFKFLPRAIKFGFFPFITLLVMNLNYRIDVYIIKYFQSSEQLGLYSISVSWAQRLWWLPEALGLVIFSRIPGMSEKAATKLTVQAIRIILGVSIPLAICYAIFSIYMIPVLYGKAFSDSIIPFLLLLPGMLAIIIYKVLHPNFTARNKAKYSLIAFALALVINVVLNLWLVPRIGLNGASISSSISYSIGAFILLIIFSKMYETTIFELLIVRIKDFLVVKDRLLTFLRGK